MSITKKPLTTILSHAIFCLNHGDGGTMTQNMLIVDFPGAARGIPHVSMPARNTAKQKLLGVGFASGTAGAFVFAGRG